MAKKAIKKAVKKVRAVKSGKKTVKKAKKKSVLLPAHIRPERYRLLVHTNIPEFTFRCEETIYLNVDKPSREIVLHGVDLNVTSATILSSGNVAAPIAVEYNAEDETTAFIFKNKIPAGKCEITIHFTGPISDKMVGFYRSKYVIAGEEKYMATTQFEATDARRAFFCVDEPAAKAVFDITFLVPDTHTAISNTSVESIGEHESGYKLIKFAETPKMSTYLVAFIVGEFDFIEGKTKEGVTVRVFVTPGKKEQGRFALDAAVKMISYYNDYFGIPYPLPVLDMIAIPDFQSGAMENWGAITYRETALLIDPANSSAAAKQRVAVVVAHELAHQWFGNLVTMKWWTHLWLNEGFASWIEYLAVDHVFPEWDIWTQFVYSDLNRALELDSLAGTHPIEVEVGHPREIREIFDAISYSKGASVIRMLADYLGEESFKKGLHGYLTKYKYANASTEHLWESLEEASGKPVGKIMRGWTKVAGYPLLSAEIVKDGELLLSQKRFYSGMSEGKKFGAKDKTVWKLPVGYTSHAGGDNKSYVLMDKKSMKIKVPTDGWIKLDANESGMFRVLYKTPAMIDALKPAIEAKRIDATDRIGFLNDAFAMSRAGHLNADVPLKILDWYKGEDNYTVWLDLATNVDDIDNLLASEKYYGKFSKYVSSIFATMAKRVGWEKKPGDGHLDSLLRGLLLASAGKYGDKEVVATAKKKFADYVSGKGTLDPDIRAVVYNLAAKNGGAGEFEAIKALYRSATLSEERMRLSAALCQFKQKPLILKALGFLLSEEVRQQDAPLLFEVAASNNFGRELVWQFIKDNWKIIYGRYFGGSMISRIVAGVSGVGGVLGDFNTEASAKDVEKFFAKNKVAGLEPIVKRIAERIRSNKDWKAKAVKQAGKFFEKK